MSTKKHKDDFDDIELPSKKKRSKNKKQRRKKKKMKKIIGVIVIELIIVAILCLVLFVKKKFDNIERYDLDKNELNITELGLDDCVNIAIFGIDARDDELNSNTRSDSMILLTMDTKANEIKLTSFYRDTYVYIDGHDYTKLTHAYSYGGPQLAISTLNDNFDLDITNFVTVNFSAVSEAIDLLGGVEIDVKEKEISSINKYGKEVAKLNQKEFTPVTKSGLQTLDGCQAVGYSRIRKIDSDLVRASRQRTVINAMFNKMKASDISTINDIVDEVSSKTLTSLNNSEILSLIKEAMTCTITDSVGFPYNTVGKKVNGASYVLPENLYDDVIKLHTDIFKMDSYTPTEDVKKYSDHINSVK